MRMQVVRASRVVIAAGRLASAPASIGQPTPPNPSRGAMLWYASLAGRQDTRIAGGFCAGSSRWRDRLDLDARDAILVCAR